MRAIVNAVMNLRVPQNVGNFLTSCEPVSFSRRTLLRAVSEVNSVSDQEQYMNFDVLLTVHLSIILAINQLNAQILVL